MQTVLNCYHEDITAPVTEAAAYWELDPIHLLALLKAESGLNPTAERWGVNTPSARDAIYREDWPTLQWVIDQAWPDISFGYSQRIVKYHQLGNQQPTVENCLAVRQAVFDDHVADIWGAAMKFRGCYLHTSCDGSALSAMVVYNAGADRRRDINWLDRYAANVVSYERALEWAEQFREDGGMDSFARVEIGGVASQLRTVAERSRKVAEAVKTVGAGTAWGYTDPLAERDFTELTALADRLEALLT